MKLIFLASAVLSFVAALILLRIFIPILKSVKLGQKILDIGPRWHKSKEGTPIMGGLFFGVSALFVGAAALLTAHFKGMTEDVWAVVISAAFIVLNLLTGFIDDYVKLFKKQNKGLSASAKLLLQLISSACYIAALNIFCSFSTELFIPFIGNVDFGFFYYPIVLIGIMYTVNCVNLTDGVDGLAGSVTAVVLMFFSLVGAIFGNTDVLFISLPMLGALVAFLVYNIHPAKIFMGDTGSLMLGGVVVACAFILKMPFIIFICGFVYIFEGLSVVLQVISFKLTGKRIFKMSPLHHHYEMSGWSENKIVTVFTLSTAVLCVISYFAIVIA